MRCRLLAIHTGDVEDESIRSSGPGDRRLERAAILLLLEGDREGWTAGQIGAELEVHGEVLEAVLGRLREDGVLSEGEGAVHVSRALERLDALGLLAI